MESLAKTKKYVIGMVGLPGRGKTYLSRKLARYLNWQGANTELFVTSEYRRKHAGTKQCTAEFFDPNNEEGLKAREECSKEALNDLVNFLKTNGDVAIYDSTNVTVEKRKWVAKYLEEKLPSLNLIWIESICSDEDLMKTILKRNVSSGNPDYEGVDSEKAIQDFEHRIEYLSKNYQELSKENDGENTAFIKMTNFNQSITMNGISGYLESKLVAYLMNLHMSPRPIYFSRHGESQFNHEDRIGGDPDLTERGYAYAKKLNQFFKGELKAGRIDRNTKLFTSTLRRALITASHVQIGVNILPLKILDEINAGTCDGLTYAEVDERYPLEAKERKGDKLTYRYPRGESYLDLIHRVEPILFEIERSREPVIVIAHQAVIRCLYFYFSKHEIKEVPYISVPLHTVIKLEPETYFCHEYRYTINVETGDVEEADEPKPLFVEDYRKVDT